MKTASKKARRYRRMVVALKKKAAVGGIKDPWVVYVLECCDGTFYTGITTDLKRRVKTHNDGKGARFTRLRRPVKVIYSEPVFGRASALVREYAIKRLSRRQKEALVSDATPPVAKVPLRKIAPPKGLPLKKGVSRLPSS